MSFLRYSTKGKQRFSRHFSIPVAANKDCLMSHGRKLFEILESSLCSDNWRRSTIARIKWQQSQVASEISSALRDVSSSLRFFAGEMAKRI
ncbi:unnamed protein product [Calypogeia fissa]